MPIQEGFELGGCNKPFNKNLDSIYFIHCTGVYKLAEVPGVVRGILKVEVKQKIYLAYVIPNGIHEFTY